MKGFLLTVCLLAGVPGHARGVEMRLGGFASYPIDRKVPCITEEGRAAIRAELEQNQRALAAQGKLIEPTAPQIVAFGWPLQPRSGLNDYGYHGISNFVDQNPAYPGLVLDYNCGTRTYDQASGYNHAGTDIFTWPFSFYKMDHDDVQIVAAAPGQIIGKDDGNFDRNCSFGSGNWNAVYVQHADGSVAWYGHMKSGSLTPKLVGQSVAQGEYLGVVGSSGNSTGPHLHLEIHDSSGYLIDPWAGPCNSLNPSSWWASQHPYYDSAINVLMTHSAPPVFPGCPNTETPNASDTFVPGQTAYFAAYYRDQLQGQVTDYRITDAVGATVDSWSASFNVPFYSADYWYWYGPLPSGFALGMWQFTADYQGKHYFHDFFVVDPSTAVEGSSASPGLALARIGPNPAPGDGQLEYRLPASGSARLAIFDAQGRRMVQLVNGWRPSGIHKATWGAPSGSVAAPGLYLAKLEFADRTLVRKVFVVR